MTRTGPSLSRLARSRRGFYRLLGALFLYPEVERLGTALSAAQEACRQASRLGALAPVDLSPVVRSLEMAVAQPLAAGAEYQHLFMATSGEALCPLYESLYRDNDRQAAVWTMAELDRTYAAAGLRLSPNLHEMPDHATVELEFMSFLCRKEAEAWETKNALAAIQTLDQEVTFLEEHLGRWFPTLRARTAGADGNGTYGPLVQTTCSFIVRDKDLVATLLADLPRVFDVTNAG